MIKRVFAIAAHPDDIEFMMAGTFILLGRAGYELHTMTLANGSCGTQVHDAETTVRVRRGEAMEAARLTAAIFHESLVNDLEIFYERDTLRRLSAIVREVAPEIILTQSTQEYMEDHQNTTRLVLSAAFARGMPNFAVEPPRAAIDQPVTIYHALPYGLRDPLRRPVQPDLFVDITDVLPVKRAMLACHRSQKEWLDRSQGLDSYLVAMEDMSRAVGAMAGGSAVRSAAGLGEPVTLLVQPAPPFAYAEGWTRHLHLGYCGEGADPLAAALGARVRMAPAVPG